jgi:staphylococcal nuclease domain-containing protein 1
LATVDQRKIDYGEAPKHLVEAHTQAQARKIGVWSLEQPSANKPVKMTEKSQIRTTRIRLSEIRSGHHFFFHVVEDDSVKVMEESMKAFTESNGLEGAACDVKVNKVVAALFDDGTGKMWYRAKIVERAGPGKVAVLFLDHGNVATVPVATHLRPLDMSLGPDKIPPVAKEAVLALTLARSLDYDEGIEAGRTLQKLAWGKDLTCTVYAPDEKGRMAVALVDPVTGESINKELITDGLARVPKQNVIDDMVRRMIDGKPLLDLAAALSEAQEGARRSRRGMWRYGDIPDDDDDDVF